MSSSITSNSGEELRCPQCTLLNSLQDVHCKACGHEFPNRNGLNGFLHKIRLPHFSINSALEKIDSALDIVTSTLTPRNAQNVQFYPHIFPGHSISSGSIQQNSSWTCLTCSQLNNGGKRCVWCTAERDIDVTFSFWYCSNSRCGLRQPSSPPNSKCPLCRTKSNWQRMQSSKSMPQLNHSSEVEIEQTPVRQIDGHEKYENTEIYRNILHLCRTNNEHFLDDSFPHTHNSIGPLSMLEKKNLTITWLRPEKIVTRDGRMMRWSVFNDPQPTDIEQGFLGNCWFLSAIAVVSERPDILEKLFLTKQYNHFGIYEMRLCIDGIWENVIVDDYFPCHKRNRSMVFGVGRKNQLWVSLLEKALAKIYGSYAVLRAGRTVEGLSTLTGAPTQSIDLEHTELDPSSRLAALDIVWAQLLSARDARFIMGCSCGAGKRPVDEAEYRRVGLMSQHAYSILDVKQTTDGHRVIHIRNPWGTFTWLGEFSQKWSGWTPQLSRELSSEANSQPGTFWMPFEKFAHYFDTVDIAQIHQNWTTTRYSIDIGWEKGKTRIVRFTITEPTEICVTLHQRNSRTTVDQVDIMVLIQRQDPSKDGYPGELICRSPRRIQPVVRTEDKFFHPGEYLLFYHSFSKFGDKMLSGALVIHSSRKVYSETLSIPLDALQASMCSLMLKEGKMQQTAGFVARYLTNEFAGLVLMVDNTNKDRCIQVCSDCQDSSNVLSTRASLFAVDSIPPLHRQIVTVLTHFEPSQSFVVGHRLTQRQTCFPQLRDFAPSTEYSNNQNFPPLFGQAIGGLHGPSSLFA